jgi:hypothetical protein
MEAATVILIRARGLATAAQIAVIFGRKYGTLLWGATSSPVSAAAPRSEIGASRHPSVARRVPARAAGASSSANYPARRGTAPAAMGVGAAQLRGTEAFRRHGRSYCPERLHDGAWKWPDIDVAIHFCERLVAHYGALGRRTTFKLTCGEPTLYKHLIELLSRVRNLGGRTGVNSTGSRELDWWGVRSSFWTSSFSPTMPSSPSRNTSSHALHTRRIVPAAWLHWRVVVATRSG